MTKIKKPLLFTLCLLPIAVIAGIFTGLWQIETLPEEMIAEIVAQIGSVELLIVVYAMQTVSYALFCGLFGYILADKTGLWKPIGISKRSLVITLAVSLIGGILFSLDYWTFGSVIEPVRASYESGVTVNNVIASILYGGVIEEVMLRLFFMSLAAFIIWKVFCRKYDRDNIPTSVFATANITAAILFAAGHLPATFVLFGGLTPMIVFRCFMMNGCFGLLFGWIYRRYGIVYSMISHAVLHIVSKLIWAVFVL